MEKRLLLKNFEGDTARIFWNIPEGKFFVVKLKDFGRLKLVQSVEDLEKKKVKFSLLSETTYDGLLKTPLKLANGGSICVAEDLGTLQQQDFIDHEEAFVVRNSLLALLILLVGIVSGIAFLQPSDFIEEVAVEEEEKEIKEIKKVKIKRRVAKPIPFRTVNRKVASTKKRNIKRMGALSALGQLQKSNQKGGLDLGSAQKSAGIGLGGLQGSGGAQTSLYAKGVVNSALGTGGNIRGAGGYGTKGKGGGTAGYGKLSLIGSAGTISVPVASETEVGGGLDQALVADVVAKNIGQIRFCYEQGLQKSPGISGRVAVDWTIGANGTVRAIGVKHSSLHSSQVEKCIIKKMKAWHFPLPKGGVDVKVSYPFLLKRTT